MDADKELKGLSYPRESALIRGSIFKKAFGMEEPGEPSTNGENE
jgi:hypothetical protein